MLSRLKAELREARRRTDEIFDLIRPEAIHERPIPERHRLIFYLGHLETFDWNMICRTFFGMEPFHHEFDRLFAFGIDPTNGKLPDDQPRDWPAVDEIVQYKRKIRSAVDECLARAKKQDELIFHVAVEHRFMHAETLTYMLHSLAYDLKQNRGEPVESDYESPAPRRMVEIPAGRTELGLRTTEAFPFGWDNEFPPMMVDVPAFAVDAFNVTNRDYLRFVQEAGEQHTPRFWVKRNGGWRYRGMFQEIPLPLDWPVYVSHADASAYARWAGKALPTETQYHRAAFGDWNGTERLYPWGNALPDAARGNSDFRFWNPSPVGSHPAGNSAFGVADLMSNGWEWTSTLFAPFPGFEPFHFYPGYSADFFDGAHFVMKGASPRTAAALLRRSFRNWFQPNYPYVYASFRCVEQG